ncbi:MAG: amidohydrolase family protein [Acidimicrobiales bacterium]
MGRDYRLISADGHVVEPPEMWSSYLPKKFADRAPKLVKDPKGGDAWELVPGTAPMPLGLVTNAGQYGKRYEDLEWFGSTYDTIRRGAFEGKARIEEQDIDGVDAEVLFPSQRTMAAFMAQEDDDYHLAGLEAYNTWMHDEFMAADPDRLIGLAQMPGVDTKTAIKWMRDAKSAGFRGVIISAYPSGGSDLSVDDDPFWEAAEEEQIPIHIHSGLRQAGKRKSAGSFQKAAAAAGREIGLAEMGGPVGDASQFMSKFIYSGIYDKFPGLQMVAVECGVGWIPHFLEHMDDHYWRNRTWTKSALKQLPSEYFRQNWKATFIREPFAVAVRHWIGVKNLMWSTDYPHHRHDWPYSRRIVEESMGGVPEAERRMMCSENAIELYGL